MHATFHIFFVYQILPETFYGSLKEYVLQRCCEQGHIVMFLSQVASALHYLHVNHIVHGDLRAEYVNVVAPDKVRKSFWPRQWLISRLAENSVMVSVIFFHNSLSATRYISAMRKDNITHLCFTIISSYTNVKWKLCQGCVQRLILSLLICVLEVLTFYNCPP